MPSAAGCAFVAVTLYDGADWADHAALYDYGFSAYHLCRGVKKGETYGSVNAAGKRSPLWRQRAFVILLRRENR